MKLFKRGGGTTSFLERNQLVIGIIASVLVVAFSAGSLLLSGGYFSRTYKVTAEFADAAGLKPGDQVKVAGLEAGSIEAVELQDGKVLVEMKVSEGVELTKDSSAEITIETLLGKKVVTLIPGASEEPLEDGDKISLELTRTPVELVDIGTTSTELLDASDAASLEEFMSNITKITEGKREDITTLIEGFGDTAEALNDRKAELSRLIDSLRTLSATFADRDDTLVNLIDNYDVVLANLAERTDDLQTLLVNTDSAAHETADLVSRNRGEINSAMQGLRTTFDVLDQNQVQLAATISYLEQAVRGYSSVGYSQGHPNSWANIFVQSLGPLGMDAALGPCGAFDQALDELLGPDPRECEDRASYGDDKSQPGSDDDDDGDPENVGNGGGNNEGGGDDSGSEPVPGDLGDILDSVTGTTGLGDALRGTL